MPLTQLLVLASFPEYPYKAHSSISNLVNTCSIQKKRKHKRQTCAASELCWRIDTNGGGCWRNSVVPGQARDITIIDSGHATQGSCSKSIISKCSTQINNDCAKSIQLSSTRNSRSYDQHVHVHPPKIAFPVNVMESLSPAMPDTAYPDWQTIFRWLIAGSEQLAVFSGFPLNP